MKANEIYYERFRDRGSIWVKSLRLLVDGPLTLHLWVRFVVFAKATGNALESSIIKPFPDGDHRH